MISRSYHGMRHSSEYTCWSGIKQRCCNPNNPSFARYGGSGIHMCADWQWSFPSFFDAIGPRPSLGHTVDRIDGTKGYEPGNVRWATHEEQAQNQAKTRFLTSHGETHCLSEWARIKGLSVVTVWCRFQSGKTPDQVIAPSRGRMSSRKLTDRQVLEMRALARGGLDGRTISKRFNVDHSTACRAISGRSFRAIDLARSQEASS